jgi:hypothetical protein
MHRWVAKCLNYLCPRICAFRLSSALLGIRPGGEGFPSGLLVEAGLHSVGVGGVEQSLAALGSAVDGDLAAVSQGPQALGGDEAS